MPAIPVLQVTKHVKKVVRKVNEEVLAEEKQAESLTETHARIYCAAVAAVTVLGKEAREKKEGGKSEHMIPAWEKRINEKIQELRADMNRVVQYERSKQGATLSPRAKTQIRKTKEKYMKHSKYEDSAETMREIKDTIRQKLVMTAAKLKKCKKSAERKRQNSQFWRSQKCFYRQLDEGSCSGSVNELPTKEGLTKYWAGIWDKEQVHNEGAKWIEREAQEHQQKGGTKNEEACGITLSELRRVIGKTQNWKAPGNDRVHNFWYKQFTNTHGLFVKHLNDLLNFIRQ